MNLSVNQHIVINQLKIGNVTNSSVLQIGTSGVIKALSNLYNTGGFTEPGPEAGASFSDPAMPLVPLVSP